MCRRISPVSESGSSGRLLVLVLVFCLQRIACRWRTKMYKFKLSEKKTTDRKCGIVKCVQVK